MTDTTVIQPPRTYTIRRGHFHWGILIVLALVCMVIGVAFYAGTFRIDNGQLLINRPDLSALRNRVQFVQQSNGTVVPVLPGADQQTEQPVASSNGRALSTTDGFGPDHVLQRTRTDTDRYDPIDRLTTAMQVSNESLTRSIKDTNKSVATLREGIDALGTKLATQINGVEGKVNALTAKVGDQGTAIDTITARVAKIETAAAQPAVVPAPAPQNQTPPQVAPQVPPQGQPQVAPIGQPQASIDSPTTVVQNGRIVTPREATDAEKRMMLQVYRDLGVAPKGAKVNGFQQLARGQVFVCPAGTPRAGQTGIPIKSGRDAGGTAVRWDCN